MQTKVIKINPIFPDKDLIEQIAMLLRKGGLIAFPTETVYGIGANYLDKNAIDRLYKIKNRPKTKPFTIHIADFKALDKLEIVLSKEAERIIHKFWPGPLTIVAFNKKKKKIGIRMPRNRIALALIDKSGVPVVAPSANISGKKSPISAEEVLSGMNGLVDIILDGGITDVQKESTVLDVTKKTFKVLREGAISKEDLLIERYILFVCTGNSCRSVMAKAMLEKFLKQAGLSKKVKVDSAGTSSYFGMTAAQNTIDVMKEAGADVSTHKGKSITPDLLKKSDSIFVMSRSHRSAVLGMLPEVDSKLKLLKENQDIPDPIGKSLDEYRCIRDMIENEIENIFLELFKKEKNK